MWKSFFLNLHKLRKIKWEIDNTKEVWKLVTQMHSGQDYGGNQPNEKIDYINYIGSVVFALVSALRYHNDIDEDLAVKCAMLHDAIEDTDFTYEDAKERFGQRVADGVLALTKNESLGDKKTQMLDSLERIKKQPKAVWMVKIADRITNLYAPPHYWNDMKKAKYREEAMLIHQELKDGSEYLANRLWEKIENYKKFIAIKGE